MKKTAKKGVPPKPEKTLHEQILDAESDRLVSTVELRHALIEAAKELLPEAVRQAKPQQHRVRDRNGKLRVRRSNGSPALLRLIARIAMRPVRIESNQQNPWSPLDPEDTDA